MVAKGETESADKAAQHSASRKRTLAKAVLYVESTYNNTRLTLTDERGNVVAFSSSGALGFRGAKKGTPFAAAKVGEAMAAKALSFGLREISVVVNGVGSGRESSIRGFVNKGLSITKIKDATPVPHNGPRPPRPRRV
ncbi:MAG: 30S ribosomal protein S11 [Candidatus Taylorbacteria bacterium RIFCSPHIGHO2_02_49_25]|uniref:Small ribosomal subunit protein uS11 n=1 Tax=Candidatus Taylorbacteria bacterium RIFCSPHIGHO2_02_49_25 TaxID=1802305 RepID=A0A1G2MH53_9BACT|nr:MAG: 30S ribosomal protein S11 [Candidatus Taylorbacteria bacterium RIFCSPHIGHO2_01_FULL_49_60]OHA23187.1 MAG: 30S ribosomal protein S11 [Candidatus Taylorbacteria bacterium RIFCSPHIGHO2_02_49_25]OHA35767.1 MAG: 30S ribosomal protein S11 [Candidatus Taylorbacteria bacterium RIFCSPLOWO2_01_FULL_50_130]OHA37011.1 MAG: 30S ribosomal protein S11 [Candidatus Taylorbacteria bacterium RIFCSPLOWO2_02_50_13]OHA40723.1 MAG: 30S ribosomal protein S11 [Candidatus Taylorbacteria bacterium RIFCSPLOWO2_02_